MFDLDITMIGLGLVLVLMAIVFALLIGYDIWQARRLQKLNEEHREQFRRAMAEMIAEVDEKRRRER